MYLRHRGRSAGTIGLATLLLLSLLALAGCGLYTAPELDEPPPPELVPEPPQVTYKVERGTIIQDVKALGWINATREAGLYFSQAGRLLRVDVKAGDKVKGGQVLAQLDSGNLDFDVAMAGVEAEKARLRVEAARAAGAGPDSIELKLLELDLKAARLRLENVTRRLDATRLVAPFDGQVMELNTQLLVPGNWIDTREPLMVVADPSSVEVRSRAPESDALRLSPGHQVELKYDSGDTGAGEIVNIGPGDQGYVTIQIRILGDIPGLGLGSPVNIRAVVQRRESVLVIPRSAVRTFGSRTYVQVLEEGRKRQVDVVLGLEGDLVVEVLEGLTEGQEVLGR